MRLLQRIIFLLALIGLLFWIGQHLGFIRLGQPLLLLFLLLLLPLGYLNLTLSHRQKQDLERLIAAHLWPRLHLKPGSTPAQVARILQLLTLFCIIVAMARPQGPPVLAEHQEQALHILMALDISDSSKATDLYPNRLEAAKQMVRTLFAALPQDRIGLAVFSGEAFSVAPFTQDKAALETLLTDIDTTLLPSHGTNIPAVIALAKERFSKISQGGKLLLIFSDGENHEGDAVKAIQALKAPDIRVFTVGTGTTAGGRIPEDSDNWGSLGFKQYEGQPVITRLNEKALKTLADVGGGSYTHVENPRRLLREIEKTRRILPAGASSTAFHSYEERFQWYLLLALLLLLLEQSLKMQPTRWQNLGQHLLKKLSPSFPHLLRKVIHSSLLIALTILLQSAWVWPWTAFLKYRAGERAYQQQNYSQSAEEFQAAIQAAPNESRLYYNQGNALYQQKKYEQAVEAYRKALSLNGNSQEQSQIWYNLGNSYFQQGKQTGNPQQSWNQALDAYNKALELNPEDRQALENKNFVAQQLQRLQQSPTQNDPQKTPPQKNKGQNTPQNNSNPTGQSSASPQKQQKNTGMSRNPGSGTQQKNQYSDQEIENFLQSLEDNERENRARKFFQRSPQQPSGLQADDLMTRPLEELEKMFQSGSSNHKDW